MADGAQRRLVGKSASVTEEETDDTSDTVHVPATVIITEGNQGMSRQ